MFSCKSETPVGEEGIQNSVLKCYSKLKDIGGTLIYLVNYVSDMI